ncbi:MAG: transposase [Akkermansiaceae bacterium]|nr:transposase [Akkermansiaceae bacterium]
MVIGRGTLPCRLVAIRLDPGAGRSEPPPHPLGSETRGRGTPRKESLARAEWRILVTNVGPERLPAGKVSDIYALRWSIEIKFRAFKQSCKLSHGLKHRSGFHHIEAMVLAAMLYHLLTLRVHACLTKRKAFAGWISIEKISDFVTGVRLNRIMEFGTLCR